MKLPLKFSLILITMIVSGFFFTACGKVVQQAQSESDLTLFNLSFSIPVKEKTLLVEKGLATSNIISTDDPLIFTFLNGLKQDGKVDELSWGRGNLTKKQSVKIQNIDGVTKNVQVTTYSSSSFRKDGLKLDRPDYLWAKSSFMTTKPYQWTVDMVKIKKDYEIYLASIYVDHQLYFIKTILKDEVASKNTLSIGSIDLYDTFISTLDFR